MTEEYILKEKCLSYLRETDWMIIRFLETDKKIPEKVLRIRKLCRNKISELYSSAGGRNSLEEKYEEFYEKVK